jgi:hypothetical protein
VDRITDDELIAQALAADPDITVPPDAVPIRDLLGGDPVPRLPAWYMPTPMGARHFSGWRRRLVRVNVGVVVTSFLVINAAGLCNTYGQLHL